MKDNKPRHRWQDIQSALSNRQEVEKARKKGHFYCPISTYIPWPNGLVYKECPLNAEHRDMDECKLCKFKVPVTLTRDKTDAYMYRKNKKRDRE